MSGEARRTIRGSSGWPSISPSTLLAPAAYQARREIEKASGPRIVTITGGLVIEVTAETRTFEPDPQRQRRYRQFLDRHIPRFAGPELYTKTCLYTIPSDQNFVLDTLPADPRVVVAVGAGHAYEFAALIGIILADLACEGTSSPPVEGFSLARLATTDPAFGKSFTPDIHVRGGSCHGHHHAGRHDPAAVAADRGVHRRGDLPGDAAAGGTCRHPDSGCLYVC